VVTVVASWPVTVDMAIYSNMGHLFDSGCGVSTLNWCRGLTGVGETTSPCRVDVGGETTSDIDEEAANEV